MKALGNLIITLSLIVGVLAAATSYFVPVGRVDAEAGLELGAVAGRYNPEENAELHTRVEAIHEAIDEAKKAEEPEPLLPPEPPVELSDEEKFVREIETAPTGATQIGEREGQSPFGRTEDPVNAELLNLLGDEATDKLKVKSFELMRWQHWWVYAIACVGLVGGATLVRIANKGAIEKAREGTPTADGEVAADPAALLASARETITNLRGSLKLIPSVDGRMAEIRDRLGGIQSGELTDFVASRELLVAQFGLGGFASLMDQLSAAERQVNRAWSAAADGLQEEAISCLALAEDLMKATEDKLASLGG